MGSGIITTPTCARGKVISLYVCWCVAEITRFEELRRCHTELKILCKYQKQLMLAFILFKLHCSNIEELFKLCNSIDHFYQPHPVLNGIYLVISAVVLLMEILRVVFENAMKTLSVTRAIEWTCPWYITSCACVDTHCKVRKDRVQHARKMLIR